MIGLGAKYLTAAGFGRYRITAASLGNLDLLGTLGGWLTKATKQAILGAFGDDGTAVINATNAYLNGIAASDMDKAQQIADWLNAYAVEDAHIVYSLVPTLGVTRWLCGDGTAYIDSQHTWDSMSKVTVEVIPRNGGAIFGNAGGGCGLFQSYYTTNYVLYATPYNNGLNVKYSFVATHTSLRRDGVDLPMRNDTNNHTGNLYVFRGRGGTAKADMPFIQIEYSDNSKLDFVPFTSQARTADQVSTGVAQAAGTCGMIDLVSGKFFPNANSSGSFTISETPSTP